MRDSTLNGGNAYLASLRSACDSARREAEPFPDAESVVSSFAGWSRDVLFTPEWMETRSERGGLSDLLTLPPSLSPFRSLRCVPDPARRESLMKALSEVIEGRESDGAGLAAWLLGRGFAKGLVAELSETNERLGQLVTEVRNLVGSHDIVHSAFGEALTEALQDSPSARSAMLSILEFWVSHINASPDTGTYSMDKDSFRTLVDEWRKAPSVAALWKGQEAPYPVHFDALEIIPNILPVDRAKILERLDGFRFPDPLRQILRHPEILHDRDEIAAILTDSPTCSDDGRSWNGSLLAPLALQTAESHCRALWEAVQRAADPDDPDANAVEQVRITLSSWFEELGRIVMARADGRFLGSHWLFMKIADERLERGRHHRAGGQLDRLLREVDLFEWISRGLSGAGLSARDIVGLVDFPASAASEAVAPGKAKGTFAFLKDLAGSSVVDVMGGEHCDPGMSMLGVVPGEERTTEDDGGRDVVEPPREAGQQRVAIIRTNRTLPRSP